MNIQSLNYAGKWALTDPDIANGFPVKESKTYMSEIENC